MLGNDRTEKQVSLNPEIRHPATKVDESVYPWLPSVLLFSHPFCAEYLKRYFCPAEPSIFTIEHAISLL